MKALGRHILAEFHGCREEILNDVERIEKLMLTAAEKARANVVDSRFHAFSPIGVSGVVIIMESHLAIHTWPEAGYAAVDLFTCGEGLDAWSAFTFLEKEMGADRHASIEILRGQEVHWQKPNLPKENEH
ncbi:MAG: adenosylmethionine decarboxylase [Bacteroidota bacterium]